ncbi:MAG: NADH-quinone oxidoreductase subunit I [Chlamydiota bacterium]|nr:NADH-quinone oxidoreductase subunit I [Chlamydiota bacterium]
MSQSPHKLIQWLKNTLLVDLFKGLYTSGKHLFRKKATVQYPEQQLEPTDRFRGMFQFDEEICIACELCVKACPIDIIYLESHPEVSPEGKRKKVLDRYDIDLKRCMFCGLCEEACPTKPVSILLTSKQFDKPTYDRNTDLYFDKNKLQAYKNIPKPNIIENNQNKNASQLDNRDKDIKTGEE